MGPDAVRAFGPIIEAGKHSLPKSLEALPLMQLNPMGGA
jgi:hypothetical protein